MLADLVMEVMEDRATDRVGEELTVLLEARDEEDGSWVGRAAHQGPEVDGVTTLDPAAVGDAHYAVGDFVRARVTDAEGIDLVARPLEEVR
ncbi:Ribosomal protein S12 methylthiotransferase RimO [bioreactor metagenome]|uniref:Ribosomal protein S12 methylthiotransferase RimO n=2 Tax=root TaxID=1 RepID=A0A645DNE1_9ZZZZ